MSNEILLKTENKLEKSINILKDSLLKIGINKGYLELVKNIDCIYCNSKYKLFQLSVVIMDFGVIVVKPFDKQNLQYFCKKIVDLDLDLNPFVKNDEIKINCPKMTTERRDGFVKKVKELGEDIKISIRNIRRQSNSSIKKLLTDSLISQDDERKLLLDIDKLIKSYFIKVDYFISKKKKELLTL